MSKDYPRIDPKDMRSGDVIKRNTWRDGVTNTYIGPHPTLPNDVVVIDSTGNLASRGALFDSYWQLVERADDKSSKDETYMVDTWVDIHGPDDVTNGDIIKQCSGGGKSRLKFIGSVPDTPGRFLAVDDRGGIDTHGRTFIFGYQKLVRTELQPPPSTAKGPTRTRYIGINGEGGVRYIDDDQIGRYKHVIDRHDGWKIYHVVDGKKGPAYTVLATPNNTNQEEGSK